MECGEILVSKFSPGTSRGAAHETSRGAVIGPQGEATWDLEGSRTDFEASRNDRKRAVPHPNTRGPIAARLKVSCAAPLEVQGTNFETKMFQPKRAIPHHITIQNMRFG